MKTTELQIGDCVAYRGNYVKVTSLYAKNGSNMVGFTDIEETWVDGSVIEPIPLAPEILEKNRFVYSDLPFIQGWQQFGLTLYRGGKGYLINCGENVAMVVNYVHQLQHALRLCGIDKEIIL